MLWSKCKDGLDGHFSVSSFYEMMRGLGCLDFPQKVIWRIKILTKSGIFLMVCDLVESPTIDKFDEKGYNAGRARLRYSI